jgi:hypothetical protein
MRKLLLALSVLALTSTTAMAQHRGHFGGHRGGHHHGHRHNAIPWIAGAAALGIAGAIMYDQYNRRCWREVVGYDRWGNPVTGRFCN